MIHTWHTRRREDAATHTCHTNGHTQTYAHMIFPSLLQYFELCGEDVLALNWSVTAPVCLHRREVRVAMFTRFVRTSAVVGLKQQRQSACLVQKILRKEAPDQWMVVERRLLLLGRHRTPSAMYCKTELSLMLGGTLRAEPSTRLPRLEPPIRRLRASLSNAVDKKDIGSS